jgi:uncharacterized protein YndB with AHSA1/START domain
MDDTVVVTIDIDAPPQRVYEAWTDPQQRIAWWGDDATYRTTKMESDLRVGGKWRTEGTSVDGKPFTVSGEYTRIEPPNVLGYTWISSWSGAATTHVLVELTPTSSGTHVSVTHSGFASAPDRDAHGAGWKRVLGWLQSHLRKS